MVTTKTTEKNFFFLPGCEDCQTSQEGDCQRHGPLKKVADTEVSTRARRSIPHILQLKEEASHIGKQIPTSP